MVALTGPCGTGKTASVYAVAQQLGLSVIEVNASGARTGAGVVRLVGEATQSQRLRRGGGGRQARSVLLFEDCDWLADDEKGFAAALERMADETRVRSCNRALYWQVYRVAVCVHTETYGTGHARKR